MVDTVSTHTIAGTELTMPVRVRAAEQHTAMFVVNADAAQRMIDYSGLQVCRFLPGRALVVLMLMHYVDSDLGQYYEYGTNVMVNQPGATAGGPTALADAAAFVHHLPVDQSFTLEAGQKIWGYPKVLADFTIREGRDFGFAVQIDGHLAVDMEFARGLPTPARLTSREQVYPTFSFRDGVLRRTEGLTRLGGVRYRPGGVRLRLGDHPYADELRALGLPKGALVSSSAASVDMTFGDAEEVSTQ